MIETVKIGTIRWHHILDPKEEDLQYLKDNFYFHPLDIEDCRSTVNQRPKIDVYDDYYFIILHFPKFDRINHTGQNLRKSNPEKSTSSFKLSV